MLCPILDPILYSAYIYLACKNTRFFPSVQTFLGKSFSRPPFFKKTFRLEWGVRRIRKWSDTTWTHGKNNFHNFYNNEQKSGN